MTAFAVPTIGVEEEHFLLDPESRLPHPAADKVVTRAAVQLGDQVSGEFTEHQIEVKTRPCGDAHRLLAELRWLRATAIDAAVTEGVLLCASGTPVLAADSPPPLGDHPRYRAGREQYRAMLDDFAVNSMHIHVHLPDRELAVRVGNHMRPWLPLLIALSANSPFHHGSDTGYADWRAVIRSRFPCLGPPPYAESLAHHEQLAAAAADSGAMLDASLPFWDVRLNPRLPTLEIRTMDVPADVEDTVALAVLTRALVLTATAKASAGDPGPRLSSEILRAAYWRAARDGWSGAGVDALTGHTLSAPAQAARLVEYIAPALETCGDTSTVSAFLDRLAARGTGAELQRASVARRGIVADVVDDLVALTART
ncbi:carboxylate-amine ligase [Mycobacterium deserti]|uniref:Putative glutamate--cysteine ligase 2 n=1 Tax=Mycobacterium deserti TaxID=2978347 RepID=A0ABT2MHT1_9MYCO|nr:glutamate--cysteine ligase [Mycobacterium deserti]MCT7661835.1 glutamate--cysteine ligase [Mycobacterium deserti]